MHIENNILKHYLRNCYFITGTAYAGKSTMCAMLAEKYDMVHYSENYGIHEMRAVADPVLQPNLCYTQQMHILSIVYDTSNRKEGLLYLHSRKCVPHFCRYNHDATFRHIGQYCLSTILAVQGIVCRVLDNQTPHQYIYP